MAAHHYTFPNRVTPGMRPGRVLAFPILMCGLWLAAAGNALGAEWLSYKAIVEVQAVDSSSGRSWLENGYGKFANDGNSGVIQPGKIGVNLDLRLQDTLWLRTTSAINSNPYAEFSFIESYLNYRPVPRSALRWRVKFGAFYAPFSLENTEPVWSSGFSSTTSVINSWIGEDVRTVGTELTVDLIGRFRQSPSDYSLYLGVFGFNDPAGAILSRRGWAQHDRQTSLLGYAPENTLGIPERIYPFKEIDNQPGFYVGGNWKFQGRYQLRAIHYDNLADDSASRGEIYAWHTKFEEVSASADLPSRVSLQAQYLTGTTSLNSTRKGVWIDTYYSAAYVLLSKAIDRHRFSFRYETFELENEGTLANLLNEKGDSWMLSYVFQPTPAWWLNVEWLRINSHGTGRDYSPDRFDDTDHQILLTVRRYFK